MTAERRHRSQSIQPELPLASPRPEPAARPSDAVRTERAGGPRRAGAGGTERAGGPRPTSGWRLDEQTRRIGREGVAAARARLNQALSTDDRKRPEGDGRRAGRAA
jgi:hypothetical protein